MSESILTKRAVHAVSFTDISTELIQFLSFENCDRNKFLKFDFKAIWLEQEMKDVISFWVAQPTLMYLGMVIFSP
jgi:hypothetical protein